MTVPANLQQASATWGAEAVYLVFGVQGGPFTVVSATDPLPVAVASTVTVSGSVTVSNTVHVVIDSGTVTTVSDAQVQGKAAQDAVSSGNPVLAGAVARRARIAGVSNDGDAVSVTADRYGRQQMVGIDLTVLALQATGSGDTDIVSAPGAGSRLKLLRIEASNSHATTALTVGLKSASLNSGSVFGKKYLPAAGGLAVWNFPGGHLLCGDNEKLTVNLSAGGQVEFTAYYETIAS
jgi:hypothetical protein